MKPSLPGPSLLLLALPVACLPAQKSPDLRIDLGTAAGAFMSTSPQIAASGSSVYVVWREAFSDICFNRSFDGGATWLSAEMRLDAVGPSTPSDPQIAASGSSVYVIWRDDQNWPGGDIYCNRSLDGGSTWLPSAVRIDVGSPPGTGNSLAPRIAASTSSVYVCWQDHRNGYSDIYCNRSLDSGTTWLAADVRLDVGSPPGAAISETPQISAAGPSVYVTWADNRNATVSGPFDIYCNASSDGGTTWLPVDVRLDAGSPPGAADSRRPQVAAEAGVVYVAWEDNRSSAPNLYLPDIYCNRSLDGGTTWLAAEARLSAGRPAGSAWSGQVAIDAVGPFAYVAWSDSRNGSPPYQGAGDIYLNRSLDAGTTWLSADIRLDVGSAPGSSSSNVPEIAVSGASVYVTWWNARNGTNPYYGPGDIYLNRSLDGGTTWLSAVRYLNVGSPPAGDPSAPRIAASGSSVYVTWAENRSSPPWLNNHDIYFNLALGYQDYGQGTAGSGARIPTLAGSGDAAIGGRATIDLADGLGGAMGVLVHCPLLGPAAIPLQGGTLLVNPSLLAFTPLQLAGAQGSPGAGIGSVSFLIPTHL